MKRQQESLLTESSTDDVFHTDMHGSFGGCKGNVHEMGSERRVIRHVKKHEAYPSFWVGISCFREGMKGNGCDDKTMIWNKKEYLDFENIVVGLDTSFFSPLQQDIYLR